MCIFSSVKVTASLGKQVDRRRAELPSVEATACIVAGAPADIPVPWADQAACRQR